jgi:hypothetical protein
VHRHHLAPSPPPTGALHRFLWQAKEAAVWVWEDLATEYVRVSLRRHVISP